MRFLLGEGGGSGSISCQVAGGEVLGTGRWGGQALGFRAAMTLDWGFGSSIANPAP